MTWQISHRSFVSILVGTFIILLALIGAFNYVVDPFAEFGSTRFRPEVEAVTDRGRTVKAVFLDNLKPRPQVLILGNSRNITLSPAIVEEQTGLRAFNAATLNGSFYDLLAFTRFELAHPNHDLRAIIVGLDSRMFYVTEDPELRRFPLIAYLPELEANPAIPYVERLLRTTSIKTSATSFNLWIRSNRQHETTAHMRYNRNGREEYTTLEQQAKAGTYPGPDPALVAYVQTNYAAEIRYDPTLSEHRALFENWLKLTRDANICVILFMPPLQTSILNVLTEQHQYGQYRTTFLNYMETLRPQYHFLFYDMESVKSFGGDDHWFVDGVHMLNANNDALLKTILKPGLCPNTKTSYAVQ